MSRQAAGLLLLAAAILWGGAHVAVAGKSVTACKVSGRHCDMRCRQTLRPGQSKRCLDKCHTTQARCIQQAYKDIELGKVPPPDGGTAHTAPPLSEEDKKDAEMGKGTPPAGRPSGSPPLQPCASWQIRYANGACGCPSGMKGPKCEEIILH